MTVESMRQALEALDDAANVLSSRMFPDAAAALRAAIEQAEKPVAWMWSDGTTTSDPDRADGTWTPLYPAPRQWVGLTDEERAALLKQATYMDEEDCEHLLMLAEAKLKEKNAA